MGRTSDARQRLINAARELIHANSYEAVTVDELCTAAGVTRSSFYHFFASKEELLLAGLECQWESLQQTVLGPAFAPDLPPHERILRFFDLMLERQQAQKRTTGHMRGCSLGNLALEMSTQDEVIRGRVEHYF